MLSLTYSPANCHSRPTPGCVLRFALARAVTTSLRNQLASAGRSGFFLLSLSFSLSLFFFFFSSTSLHSICTLASLPVNLFESFVFLYPGSLLLLLLFRMVYGVGVWQTAGKPLSAAFA